MKKLIVFVFFLVACTSQVPTPVPGGSLLPPTSATSDVCHVGGQVYCELNSDVTDSTINQTICVSGWTATVRPPVSYTEPIKQQELSEGQNLHNGDTSISDYELDHRMPLELGGNPTALENLSLEYPRSTNPKDLDENYYKNQVCSGAMTLEQAQTALINKWLDPYPTYKQ